MVHAQSCDDKTLMIQIEGGVQESYGQGFSLKIGGKQVCEYLDCTKEMATIYK
jgi:hypothetical protein